jgi:hypothetical protein
VGFNDTLDGGADLDTVYYSTDLAGVVALLDVGLAIDGAGGIDRLIGIENVIGSNYADLIVGNEDANDLDGGSASGIGDTIRAGGGNDTLRAPRCSTAAAATTC